MREKCNSDLFCYMLKDVWFVLCRTDKEKSVLQADFEDLGNQFEALKKQKVITIENICINILASIYLIANYHPMQYMNFAFFINEN